MFEIKLPGSSRWLQLPTISFKPKEFVWLKGASGSGKSTLLLVLKGIIPKYLPAQRRGNMPKAFENAGYLFQNPYSQLVSPYVKEELAFGMENQRFSSELMLARIKAVQTRLHFKLKAGLNTAYLSGGECQQLVLASMLAADPELIILDEPTAFLDVESSASFYKALRRLKGKHTIVLVDHNYNYKWAMHNRVITLKAEGEESRSIKPFALPEVQEPSLEISNLSFAYKKGQRLVLKDFNLKAKGPEIIGILGSNGCGKSTLLKLIAGLLKPTSGLIQAQGLVSLLFQNPEHHFYFDTVRQELPHGHEQLIKAFGLSHLLRQSPFSLSEGQKRRLTILMAVLLGRSILLYDEPTFGQDPANISLIEGLMKLLQRHNRLQILVTHDQELVHRIATRIYKIEDARSVTLTH